MLGSALFVIACVTTVLILGWVTAGMLGALVLITTSAVLWFMTQAYLGALVLRWLRQADAASIPNVYGIWREVIDRIRRLLRAKDLLVTDSQNRLHEFLAAIQASPNGVVLLDAEGRIEWCNQTAADHFGFDAQRDVLQHLANLVRDPLFAGYHASNDYTHELIMQGPTSVPSRPVRLAVHLHPYGEGRSLLLSRDVTAVEQAEAMRRDFVANVSHEIRTPLTVVAGFIETLQTLPLSKEEQTHYLGLMAQQSARVQTLVSDLLTLSKLEGSPPPGLGEWTSVQALTSQCELEGRALSDLLTQAHARRQDIHFKNNLNEFSALEVAGNHNELLSAMSNLLTNAVRYTPPGGMISVEWCKLPDGRADFAVTDTGPGIAAEHISRLTERFYRVDRSRSRETGGTGLGLAIVKHVAQRHGAELRIDSTPGHGSRFAITFPANRIRTLRN
jgi:two-component system, OmpR family, phosphate regulon sensor histidine kinase PhoR